MPEFTIRWLTSSHGDPRDFMPSQGWKYLGSVSDGFLFTRPPAADSLEPAPPLFARAPALPE